MRYYIYISLVAVLSVFCFNNAMGQRISPFGANRPQDTSKTKGQIVATAYANPNPAMFVRFDSKGHMIMAVPAGSGGGLVDSVTISNDSLFYWGGGVSFFVGIVNSGGSVDTTGLSDRINYNLTRIDGLSDTASNLYDTAQVHEGRIATLESEVANTTWQDVLDVGRVGDSVLISNKLFVGTTEDYKPISIQVIGDSRDAAVFGGIAPLKIWPQRVANLMGANLNQALAQPSTFFMNEEPRFNPLDDTSAVMDVILTDKIKSVVGLSDSDYYLFVTRCINDLHWYTTEDSGYNYTPENFGRDYRIFMDSIVNKGYDMNKVVLMGPKYVLPTSTMVIQDSVYRWIDTVRQVAADYGCKFFDAFHWEQGRGGASLLDIDDFHENETGHAVLTKGMIVTIAAPVKRNGQTLAVNGIFETNRMIFRGGNDSSTANSWVMMVNANGEVFTSGNKVIWNNPIDSGRQEADINVAKMKARSLDLTGINSVSLKIGNNTAIQGGAASGGVVYLDASGNTTGTVNVRAGSTTTFNSTEVSSTVPFRSSLMWVGVAVQGNSASNGTLYLDASKNTTGTINIRAGATYTFNSSGFSTSVGLTALKARFTDTLTSSGNVYFAGLPKAATKDSVVGWESGRLYAIPKPASSTDSAIFAPNYRVDTAKANLRTQIAAKEPTITAGTSSDYWQGDKTWQPKSGLPIGTATQAALDGKVPYTDTSSYLPTKYYLANNYFVQGGNLFSDSFQMGNYAWYQMINANSSGRWSNLNGAGDGWYWEVVQNSNDTAVRLNKQNELLIGTLSGGSPVDAGRFKLQVHQNLYIRDTVHLANLPKAATKDSILAIQNGTVYSIPKPSGSGGGDVSFTDTTLRIGTKYDIDTVNAKIPDVSGFISWADTVSDIGTKHDIDTLATSIYGAGYLPAATAASTYVSLSGSYSNPTWVTALAWSKITGTPTTLSGYGITNAVVNTTTVNGQALSSNVTLDIDDVAPTQTGNANKILTTDGTNATWQAPTVGVTINTQSGTTYTLLSSDNGKVVEFTNSSAVTVTVPTGLGTSFTCIIRQNGTGDVTLSASGTTINNANSHTSTRAQYSAFAIIATSTANTFITQGDMD